MVCKVDAEPGFTKPAFDALKGLVLSEKERGRDVICALLMDEISIRKHTQWDEKRQKFRGFVDMGCGTTDTNDNLPLGDYIYLFIN